MCVYSFLNKVLSFHFKLSFIASCPLVRETESEHPGPLGCRGGVEGRRSRGPGKCFPVDVLFCLFFPSFPWQANGNAPGITATSVASPRFPSATSVPIPSARTTRRRLNWSATGADSCFAPTTAGRTSRRRKPGGLLENLLPSNANGKGTSGRRGHNIEEPTLPASPACPRLSCK